jgi:hypothetical protein
MIWFSQSFVAQFVSQIIHLPVNRWQNNAGYFAICVLSLNSRTASFFKMTCPLHKLHFIIPVLFVRSEVFTVVKMSMLFFSIVTLCGLVGRYQCFREGWRWRQYVSPKCYESTCHHNPEALHPVFFIYGLFNGAVSNSFYNAEWEDD